MSFLAPLFLLGTAAIALPILFHLVRRSTRTRQIFSSLLFLRTSPPRLNRRSRLEHLLLLTLRCLALALLALAFARPFLKHILPAQSTPALAQATHILIDASASMRRGNLWNQALQLTRDTANNAQPGDLIAISLFHRSLQPLVSFDQWRATPLEQRPALLRLKLDSLQPSWDSAHLANAITEAADQLADSPISPGPARILLLSDLQPANRAEALQGFEWPKNVALAIEPLQPTATDNASIQPLASPATDTGEPLVHLRILNNPGAKREQFEVGWSANGQFLGNPEKIYVPAGQSRTLRLKLPNDPAAAKITLAGDAELFDNSAYVVPPQPGRTTVLYLGNEPDSDPRQPLFFLQRAFAQPHAHKVNVLARPAANPGQLNQPAALVIVNDPLPENALAELRQQIQSGQSVLVHLKSPKLGPTLAGLLNLDNLPLPEAGPAQPVSASSRYFLLAEIDFQSPAFAIFAGPTYSDFTKIRFWNYRRLDPAPIPNARTLAAFDNGDPALLEILLGRGRLLVLTSGWHPHDSQFALSTKFVPFLYGLLAQAGTRLEPPPLRRVGDAIPLANLASASTAAPASPWRVRLPDQSEADLPAGTTAFAATQLPGVYTLTPAAPGAPPDRVAVNLDPAELAHGRLNPEDFEQLGAPLYRPGPAPAQAEANRTRLAHAELEQRQKIWRYLILAAIAILLLETWLAARALAPNPAAAPTGEPAA